MKLNLRLIRRSARAIRTGILIVTLLFAAGLVYFKPAVQPPRSPLAPGVHRLEIPVSFLGHFYRHRLHGSVHSPRWREFEVTLSSRQGHIRVDPAGSFRLPVGPNDSVAITVSGPAEAAVTLGACSVERVLLPGGWVALAILGGLALYFHRLGLPTLTRQQCLNYLLLGGSSVAAVLFIALLAQLLDARVRGAESWHLFPPRLDVTFYVYADLTPGLVEGPVRFTTSSEGIRARERPQRCAETTSILCLGASTTECLYHGEDGHWPAVLEAKLHQRHGTNVWVGNAGHAGFSTSRIAAVADNYIPRLKPKHVVLLTGFNEGVVPDAAPPLQVSPASDLSSRVKAVLKRVAFVRIIRHALFRQEGVSPNDVDMSRDNSWMRSVRETYQSRTRLAPPRDQSWENLDLSEFERHVRHIAELTRMNGGRLILCTQPTLYRPDLTPRETSMLWMGATTPRAQTGIKWTASTISLAGSRESWGQRWWNSIATCRERSRFFMTTAILLSAVPSLWLRRCPRLFPNLGWQPPVQF